MQDFSYMLKQFSANVFKPKKVKYFGTDKFKSTLGKCDRV